MSYTTGDVFTHEYYVNYAKQIESLGADSICIKDMAALLTPYEAGALVSELKKGSQDPDTASHSLHHRFGFHVHHEGCRGRR